MNCSEVRTRLPALLYGDLKPDEVAAVEHHLTTCPACRAERTDLQRVRHLLSAVPVPTVQVDLPLLYQRAADRQARRLRRWRRAALALGAVAALLLLALGLGLEVRLDARQLVLRWGPAPAEKAGLEPRAEFRPVRPEARTRPDVEERLQLMNELIHALSAEVGMREERQRQDLDQLRQELEGLRRLANRRWSETERTVAALYAAHLTLTRKGDEE
jgi:anti-sigma factor RsiW